MLFNSFHFLLFFPLVTLGFFLAPHRFRWFILLAASCYFYMFFIPYFILVLGFTIVVDYFSGIMIEDAENRKRKLIFLLCSIAANVGVLAYFKYYDFFVSNINDVLVQLGINALPLLKVILPIGLSFHTFQAMSYIIEVYRGNQKAERHFGYYALYVMFYPQLVAGPIERPQNVLHQFHAEKRFSFDNLHQGMRLIIFGLFKKVVVADRLAVIVNEAFNDPAQATGWQLVIAVYAFSIQIYCDFSGYSDIALGTARTMGFDLMRNFNRPYFARSVSEFWSRWHISLSTWFRDYVYIPLGGNRRSIFIWLRNIMIVFLISGLWHGANWTFVIWGALNGIYLVAEILLNRNRKDQKEEKGRGRNFLRIIFTFHLVTFAWIFFRAESLADAFFIIKKIGFQAKSLFTNSLAAIGELNHLLDLNVILAFFLALLLFAFERNKDLLQRLKPVRPYAFFVFFLLMIAVFGTSKKEAFIYFQF